ncbi:MAG: hypothetical protein V4611_01725 [Patescibacteria group bacterium]
MSRPADRRAVRPEAQRQPEQSQPVRVSEPQPADKPATTHRATKDKKAQKSSKTPLVIGIIVLVLAIGGWLLWSSTQNRGTAIDTNKYQAVFLANGQIYFGKLELPSGDYMKLTDVYYLQTQTEDGTETEGTQEATSDQSKVQLIKLGEKELHAPEDLMVISKDQVLYYENIKDDSKVAQTIEQYKKAN